MNVIRTSMISFNCEKENTYLIYSILQCIVKFRVKIAITA